jgi:hypothetical protein
MQQAAKSYVEDETAAAFNPTIMITFEYDINILSLSDFFRRIGSIRDWL